MLRFLFVSLLSSSYIWATILIYVKNAKLNVTLTLICPHWNIFLKYTSSNDLLFSYWKHGMTLNVNVYIFHSRKHPITLYWYRRKLPINPIGYRELTACFRTGNSVLNKLVRLYRSSNYVTYSALNDRWVHFVYFVVWFLRWVEYVGT